MEYLKSRDKFYDQMVKTIEEKTIKEKAEIPVEVINEEKHCEWYNSRFDSYIFEGNFNSLSTRTDIDFEVGSIIYIKKVKEPLIVCIVQVKAITEKGDFIFELIDSFEPPVLIEEIDKIKEEEK